MRTQSDVMYILFKRGWKVSDIAELLSCDAKTVRRHVDQERWKHWEVAVSQKELQRLYSELGSIRKVAEALMCSTGVIIKKMNQYGIKRDSQGRKKKCSQLDLV